MSQFTDYFNGKIKLNDYLESEGYGGNGGVCIRCHRPLKQYPVYSGQLCLKCYTPRTPEEDELRDEVQA